MEDKEIRWLTSSITQRCIQPEHNRQMGKSCIPPFPQKRWPQSCQELSKTVKVYNTLLLNCIEPEIEKVLWKNQNDFQGNWSTTSQNLTIRQILKEFVQKKKNSIFLQGVWFHTQREDAANTSNVRSPQRNCHSHNPINPIPPLGQDMTEGQFLSGV